MPAQPRRPHRHASTATTSTGPATTRALLTRISTDEINQPYSLEAQDTRLEQFVASQPGMTITHRFTDQASGATLERPGLQRALELARAGTFDVLLVYRIDRLSRSIVGLMAVVEQLEQAGVALKSATEPIDTQGPVRRMLLQLLGIFAEFERGMLIDRITAGFEREAARGEWLGGRGPCGYDLDKDTKTLAVNATEAPIVQAIFDKYVTERLGATAIANWLNDTGRRTKYGSLWSGQTVLRMLRNPVYIGKISHDDATHDGKHDAILDPAVFEQAQQILDERAGDRPQLMSKSDYLLSGLTRCTSCHGAYVGISANGRLGRYRYYACRSRQAKGKRACPAERVRADGLETAVIDAVLDTYANIDLFEHTIAEAVAEIDSDQPHLADELASVEAQIRDTTAALDRYLRAFEAGDMSHQVCGPRVEELSQQRHDLIDRRDELAAQTGAATTTVPPREQLEAVGELLRATIHDGTPTAVKDLLNFLIDSVEIAPNRHAQPFFQLPCPPEREMPEPDQARAPNGTTFCMDPRQVEVRGIEPRSKCLSSGSATSVGLGSLSGCRTPKPSASAAVRHAKVSPPARDDSRQVEPGSDARPSTPGE